MRLDKIFSAMFLFTMVAIILKLVFTEPPRLPIDLANGSYTSQCCGSIDLLDGQMLVDGQSLRYVIEDDKIGAYVLPTAYVSVSGFGLTIDRNRHPLKLRLDDNVNPRRLEIVGNGQSYPFDR